MKAASLKAVLSSAGLVALSACGGLYVQAEEPQVCQSVPFQLPGTPASQRSSTISLSQKLTLPNIPNDSRVEANLYLQSLSFEATAGVSDLSFIDDMKLTTDRGEANCNQLSLMQYNNSSGENVQSISSDGPKQDLFGCVLSASKSGNRQLAVNLTISGRLPSQEATIGMISCLSAKIRLNYASH
jgi:hypothetical protein